MKTLILMASATAMAVAMPALAQGQGKGKGAAAHTSHSVKANAKASGAVGKAKARTDARANVRAKTRTAVSVDRRIDSNANGIADYREQRLADANNNGVPDYRERRLVDTNGNGIADYKERLIDRDRDGVDDRAENRYGGAACPPGLAKKTPACVPPGQAKRMFAEGQRIPVGYDYFTDYARIPESYRDDIPDIYRTDGYRYIYRDDRIYVVDNTTRLVRTIIDQFD